MDIKIKQNDSKVIFTNIPTGGVFIYKGDAYMRLDQDYCEYDNSGYEGECYNAVSLYDGELVCVGYGCEVFKPTKVIPMEVTY